MNTLQKKTMNDDEDPETIKKGLVEVNKDNN